ncbi:MAG: 23S rRNA (uracil(1939)-C(5))-methyltransferase RlmD [Bacteroidetes bacterium]|nr:23S rRNA (uracil(1939)-C(5))-methyltransferase RlmD [Bacteroidota bacterium]
MNRGDIVELKIEDYAFEGKGIARVAQENEEKKFIVFVNGSYPGDVVKAQIFKKKKSYAEAKTIEVVTPSEFRTKAQCSYFGVCGGCKQQDLIYSKQLEYKSKQVKDILERLGGLSEFKMEAITPSDKTIFYRNKMEFSFAEKRWLTTEEINESSEILDRDFSLGLHIPRVFDKALDINECFLQSEESNQILNFTRKFFKERKISIYSTKTHEGYLRNLVIKQSHHTNDLMVNLVTSNEDESLMMEYTSDLLKQIPAITTVINNINLKKSQVALGDYEKVFHGSGYIFDLIGKYKFRISANSFFQTNTLQAAKLYQTVLDFAEFNGSEIVYDLYSGAGTISIYMSEYVKKVYAFESVQAAVEDANTNNGLNDVKNIEYFEADLNKSFIPIIQEKNIPTPDVIVADPPRNGMNPKTVKDIIQLNPPKIVYVSCNPATQARDLKQFSEAGFKIIKSRPVDMFPHTYHIENVVFLTKN